MSVPTLWRQHHPFAEPLRQREVLAPSGRFKPFEQALAESGLGRLQASGLTTLQVNLGKMCNQTCRHCHVDAGPERPEQMTQETMRLCLEVLDRWGIPILDVTGGAPEMHPHFRWLVAEARRRGRQVLDRCNLTILLTPAYQDLPFFLAEQRVEVVASLPCYGPANTDAQRGQGVFSRSIEALQRLNALGYGVPGGELVLNLVYNPVGPTLPPAQAELEAAYRRELEKGYGVRFNRLFTITNMPISRFLDDLVRQGCYEEYMHRLIEAYNPAAAAGVMCRTTLSVGWDGQLYDCDFNQMLGLNVEPGRPQHIREFDLADLAQRHIVTGQHCYGCTAGCGSGCQGAIVV